MKKMTIWLCVVLSSLAVACNRADSFPATRGGAAEACTRFAELNGITVPDTARSRVASATGGEVVSVRFSWSAGMDFPQQRGGPVNHRCDVRLDEGRWYLVDFR